MSYKDQSAKATSDLFRFLLQGNAGNDVIYPEIISAEIYETSVHLSVPL